METEQTMKSGILKRILSFALSCAMILSCVPAAVFAEAPEGAQAIKLGVEATAVIEEAGAYAYFTFTPEQTERYTFYSSGYEDTFGYLYNSNMNQLASDDVSGSGNNFSVSYKLQAGVTYIFGAKHYSSDYTGSFPVMLEISHDWNEENVCSCCGKELGESGTYGENLTWTLDGSGTLTISGEGEMPELSWSDSTPWSMFLPVIKQFVIEDGITNIGSYTFGDCYNLQNVRIGSDVASIDLNAFNHCGALQEITVSADNTNYASVDGVLFSKDKTSLLKYPIGKMGAYAIPEGTETISEFAFNGAYGMSSLIIPKSVTAIQYYAFAWSSLNAVSFTGAAPEIDDYAFVGVGAVVRYPGNDSSWTAEKRKGYGGALTWITSDTTDMPTAQTIAVGEDRMVTIENEGDCAYFRFTPEADGMYTFYSTGDGDTVGYLFDSSMDLLAVERYNGGGQNFSLKATLKAGRTYFFGARYHSDITGSFAVALEGEIIQTVIPGTVMTAEITEPGAMAYFTFTPAADGYYEFATLGDDDVSAELYDSNMEYIDINPSWMNNNCRLICALKAGTTYYFGIRCYRNVAGIFSARLDAIHAQPVAVGSEAAAQIAEGGRTAYFSFTPDATGNYMVYAKSDSYLNGEVYDSQMNGLPFYHLGRGDGFATVLRLEARNTYYLAARSYDEDATGSVTAGLYAINAQSIQEGAEAVANIDKPGRIAFFSFTPETTDVYTFTSMGNASYGDLYSSNMERLQWCDYGVNGRFYIRALLEKGETYYFSAGLFMRDGVDQTGSYSVKLEQTHEGAAIKTEPADCTNTGLITKLCEHCGEEFTEVIPANGHRWDDNNVCTECGEELGASGTCGESLTWTLDKEGVLTITGSGAMDDYIVFSNVGKPAPWNEYTTQITKLVVGKNVTTIGDYAFFGLHDLQEVKIGGKVASIGSGAFMYCGKLSELSIPASVKYIEVGAFGYSGIENIQVAAENKAFTSVDGVLFSKDKSTLVAYPSGREGAYAIPAGTAKINAVAFEGASKLSAVVIPDSVTTMEGFAFSNCTGLESVQIGSGIKTIPEFAFQWCQKLKQVTIPKSVNTIEKDAFASCQGMEALHLGKAVKTIGERAFAYCDSLKEVTIPASVTSIGTDAFAFDEDLNMITFEGKAPEIANGAFSGVTAVVQYPGNDATWTADKLRNYGGRLTWVPGNPMEIAVSLRSEEMLYFVGDTFDKNDLQVTATYENGRKVNVPIDKCDITLPDLSTPGIKTIAVSYGGLSGSVQIGVHGGERIQLNPEEYPESDHDYADDCDETWTVHIPGASQIALVFSNDTYVEEGCDFITVSSDTGFYAEYTGDEAAGRRVLVPGDTVKILLTSDSSETGYGFSFSSISGLILEHVGENLEIHQPTCEEDGWIPAYNCSICGEEVAKRTLPATGHKYEDGKCTVCGKLESIASGVSGEVSWNLTDGDVLTISGTGAMADYSAENPAPWQTYADKISKVVIDSGVTAIGAYAFSELPKLPIIQIPASVQAIGCNGLSANENLVVVFQGDAFQNPENQSISAYNITVYYPKDNDTWTEELLSSFGEQVIWKEVQCTQGLEHELVIDEAVEPSCSATGLTEGSHCSVCGEVVVEQTEVGKLAHTEEIDEAVPATCSATGLTEGSHCSVCGEVVVAQTVVDKLPHTEEIDEAVPATCSATGLTEGSHCSVCGEVVVEQTVVDKLPHTEEIDEAVPATCSATGLTEGKHCSVCGEVVVEQTVVDKLPHTVAIDEAVAPTCTETGLTEGKHCEVCGEVIVEQTTVDATGHTLVNDGYEAPTCTEDGFIAKVSCSVCGEIIEENKVLPAAHQLVHKEPQKATLEEDGYLVECYVCSVCEACFLDENGEEDATECVIPAVDIVRLSSTRYSYDGKTKTPKVGVYDSKGNKLVKDQDYTVTYAKGRKSVGQYNVTMKGIGNYSFRITLTFQIVPPKSSIKSLTGKAKSFIASWTKKTSQVTGYQLQYSLDKNFETGVKTVTIKDNDVTSKTIKSLKSKKYYYVRIRTYKTVSGKNFYSSWSDALRVKTK